MKWKIGQKTINTLNLRRKDENTFLKIGVIGNIVKNFTMMQLEPQKKREVMKQK